MIVLRVQMTVLHFSRLHIRVTEISTARDASGVAIEQVIDAVTFSSSLRTPLICIDAAKG
jgi:hypothetical protein